MAHGDRVLYERSFGAASYELAVPNRPSTRFSVASITKPVTILAAIHLIESGKLGLDDPLARWLPDFPRGDEITVAHLLRHRAGLPHRVTTSGEEAEPRSAAEMAELAGRHPLLFAPGSDSAYSSAGYSVLARVLELAGGKSYGELIDEVVLAPAGAVHTLHPRARQPIAERAQSYFRGPAGPITAPLRDLSYLVGAGSLYSTPRDLFALQRHLLSGGFGELARQNLLRDDGLRWNGITNGYRAFADYHADRDLTVIFTGNLFTGAGDLLRRQVPRLAAGEEMAPPEMPRVTAAPLAAELRPQLEGRYQLRPGSIEPLSVDGDLVTLGDWVLIPTGEETFFSPQDYVTVHVVRAEDGSVEALSWGPPGGKGPVFPRLGPLAGKGE